MKHPYKVLGFLLNKYKNLYLVIMVMGILVAFLESFNIAAILPLISIFLGDNSGARGGGYFLSGVDAILGIFPFGDRIMSACALVLCITLIKTVLKIFNEFMIAYASGTVLYDIKKQLLDKYSKVPYKYLLDNKYGSLVYYVLQAPPRIARMLYTVSTLFTDMFTIIFILAFLFTINFYITLVLIFIAAAFNGLIIFVSRKVSYLLGREQLNEGAAQGSILNEFISGSKQLRVYNAAGRWINLFNAHSRRASNLYIKDVSWTAVPNDIVEATAIILLIGAAIFLKTSHPANAAAYVPIIGVFGMGILKLLPCIRNAGRNRLSIWGLLSDAEAVHGVLTVDLVDNWPGKKEFTNFKDSINFADITFSYDGQKKILENATFTFQKNRVSAVIGTSGAGKTTIINMLLGLFRQDSGRILIDGVDLREYRLDSWFNKVAIITQDPFVFHSTVAENISFGDERYTRADIEAAAKIANAHGFITQMLDGYDTVVGEKGMKLSGGQQQRIAIARAIIRKPQILIMDEATSHLDSVSESAVQASMNEISKICTLIIIAHRLSTVKNADRILVLQGGRIEEEGDHEELIAKGGFYKRLYEHQRV